MEEFGDIDDADAFKRNYGKIRKSIDGNKKRETLNVKGQDIAQHRLQKDILAASVTDSMMGTQMFGKGQGRRTGSKFNRRANET